MHIAQWQQFHGPLIAFAVALGRALAGRFLRIGSLAAAAGGAGVVAGWYAVAGRLWTTSPLPSVEALTELAPQTRDPEQLTELSRQRLSRQITASFLGSDGTLSALQEVIVGSQVSGIITKVLD